MPTVVVRRLIGSATEGSEARMNSEERRVSRSTLLVAAVVAVSTGNMIARYWDQGFVLGVLLIALAGVLAYAARWAPRGPAPRMVWVIGIVASAISIDRGPLAEIFVPVIVIAVVSALFVRPPLYPLLLLVPVILISVLTIDAVRTVRIDAFSSIQNAATALVHGSDPYMSTYVPDSPITPTQTNHYLYGPSVVLLAVPGRLLGDVRFSSALMMVVIGISISHIVMRGVERSVGRALTALVVVCPLIVSMVALAFAESYSVALLAAWLACRDRHRRVATIALAFCITAKPTIGAVILVAALWSRSVRRDLGGALAVGVLVCVPFVIWDGAGNFWATMFVATTGIGPHAVDPNAASSLGINALAHLLFGEWLPPSAIFALLTFVTLPILLTRPRDRSDIFALGGALTIAVIVCGWIANLNYYFVAAAALFLALAYEGAPDVLGDLALPAGIEHLRARVEGHFHTEPAPAG